VTGPCEAAGRPRRASSALAAASARRFESGGQLAGKEFLEPFFRVAGDVRLLTRFDPHPHPQDHVINRETRRRPQ
jgi:hypothetical protein